MNFLCLLGIHKWPSGYNHHPRKDLPLGDYKVCKRCGLIKKEISFGVPLLFFSYPEKVEYHGYTHSSRRTQ